MPAALPNVGSASCAARVGGLSTGDHLSGAHSRHSPRSRGQQNTVWATTGAAHTVKYVRRRPTLPHAPACSTIGAEGLNFQVRNGAGCFPFAMVAETLLRCGGGDPLIRSRSAGPTVSREPHSGREQCSNWSEETSPRPISTGRLVHYCLPPPAYQPSVLLGALPG